MQDTGSQGRWFVLRGGWREDRISHGEGTHGGLEVVAITGHKDPRMLMRSTHLKVEDLVSKVTMEKGAG